MNRLWLLAVLMLAGCASAPPVSEVKADPVTCADKTDCDAKWSRAVSWVTTYADYKIQTTSDNLIQTYGPERNSARPALTITRAARPNGVYEMALTGDCDSSAGCVPSVAKYRISFANFVNGR